MTPRDRLFSAARDPVWAVALAVLTALAISFVVVLASGKNAALGLAYLFEGAFGGPGPLGETAVKSGVQAPKVSVVGSKIVAGFAPKQANTTVM